MVRNICDFLCKTIVFVNSVNLPSTTACENIVPRLFVSSRRVVVNVPSDAQSEGMRLCLQDMTSIHKLK